MSATFPQLLKRSAFAAHDSLITRVYSATPSSVNKGDWGLKNPIKRRNGSLHIKVEEVDHPLGVGATWSSGENDARFIAQWGDGSVPWDAKARKPARASIDTLLFAQDLPEPTTKQVLPDLESMTEREFDNYLAHVREHRETLRKSLYSETGRAGGAPADESTLTHAAVRGATRDADSADFQASLINEELAEPASDRLQPRPHRVGGIAYSAPAPGRAPLDSARIHKGRVLDRTHRAGSSFREGTNANWVVGLGGVTAAAASGTSRIADKASLSQFDYQRTRPAAGIAHFSVSDATLLEKAKVVDLYGARSQGERFLNVNVSAINRPAPLKSVRFNIDVDEAPAPSEQAEIGSAEWVARTRAAPTVTSGESDLGVLGSRRSARARGAGAAAAHRMSARVASENIDNLLAKLKQLKK